jgi:ubiquinol-cytochrome c reductase cytochrome c1 subunit
MKKLHMTLALCLITLGFTGAALAESEEGHIEHAGINIRDVAAVQRGAKWYVNYCFSCHSAKYMRYNRLARDLNLSEEAVMKSLVFSDAKFGDTMDIAMMPDQAALWLGKTPPDLSVIARSRGADWLFTFLRTFYQDESGKWNNLSLPNAAMPHVLWQLQGIQKPVYATRDGRQVVDRLELAKEGLQTPEEFEQTVRDLVTFLDYVGEPAKLERKSYGIWVMLFLAVFALLAFALKAEFWRDVH